MPDNNRRDASAAGPGSWKVTQPGVSAPKATAKTQSAAERIAKSQVRDAGGGQVYIRTPKGVMRDADTVDPDNESPTRDKKH